MPAVIFPSVDGIFERTVSSVASSLAERKNFLLPAVSVLTRERVTSDYLAVRLAELGLPSFGCNIFPYREAVEKICDFTSLAVISNETAILLIESLLGGQVSGKARLKLAGELFSSWEDGLLSGQYLEPDPVYAAFQELKGPELTRSQAVLACLQDNLFRAEDLLKEEFGDKIIFYSIAEMEPVIFDLLQKTAKIATREILLLQPSSPFAINDQLPELPEKFILSQLQKKKIKIEYSDARYEPPKLRFLEARERYREIEYIGRDILKTVTENRDNPDFRLTAIKVCLPVRNEEYFYQIRNIFSRLGIPSSMTYDVVWKTSSYYTAFMSLVDLIDSDYNVPLVFRLLKNPCFRPVFLRDEIDARYWQNLASATGIAGWLDTAHRKRAGITEVKYLTWEDGFRRIAGAAAGIEDHPVVAGDDEEQANRFMTTVSSLLNDLEAFSGPDISAEAGIRYLRIMADTYLDAAGDPVALRTRSLVYGVLDKAEKSIAGLGQRGSASPPGIKNLVRFYLDRIATGSSGILKKGVVIGTLKDTTDPSFKYIYCPGLNESVFPDYSAKNSRNARKESEENALRSRIAFYQMLRQNAAEVVLSYVSLDTIKDRPYYPSSEYTVLKNLTESVTEKIPLFSDEEVNAENAEKLRWENHVLQMHYLQKLESHPDRKNRLPSWHGEDIKLYAEYKNLPYYDDLLSWLFRKRTEAGMIQSEHLLNLSQLAGYMTCPARFHFTMLAMEEEAEFNEDAAAIDSLSRSGFLRDAIRALIEELDYHADETVFNEEHYCQGVVPAGIRGAALHHTWDEKTALLEERIKSDILLKDYAVVKTGFKFGEPETDHAGNPVTYDGPVVDGKRLAGKIDCILQAPGNKILLCNFSASAVISPVKILAVWLVTAALQGTGEWEAVKKGLALQGDIVPAVINFRFNDGRLEFRQYSPVDGREIIERYSAMLAANYFPYTPVLTKGKPVICGNCPVSPVCFALERGEFEGEPDKLEELLKSITGEDNA